MSCELKGFGIPYSKFTCLLGNETNSVFLSYKYFEISNFIIAWWIDWMIDVCDEYNVLKLWFESLILESYKFGLGFVSLKEL